LLIVKLYFYTLYKNIFFMKAPDVVLNNEGRIYHLNLAPGDVAETIILVGDPARASVVSGFFDNIEFKTVNREIHTFTGTYKGKRISVLSTGMGTDNIEIVVSELDALFNVDLSIPEVKQEKTVLKFIRLGTSGALQDDIPVIDSRIASAYGLGLDGLLYFYEQGPLVMERELTSSFNNQMEYDAHLPRPYAVMGSAELLEALATGWLKGITLTAPGFYAPQGREVRLKVADESLVERASAYKYNGFRVTNFEMETSALYALSAMLGHRALTVCDIIANRVTGQFNPDYKTSMKTLIREMLDRIAERL
jgi:uridine phosphorylase